MVVCRIEKVLYFWGFLLTGFSLLAQAETVTLASGMQMQGRIGKVSQNIVQFYSDRYYALQLDEIREVAVDQEIDEQQRTHQLDNVKRLQKLIHKEKFLVGDFGEFVRILLRQKKYTELDQFANQLLEDKSRFPSGIWKLTKFYEQIYSDVNSRDVAGFMKRIGLIEDWARVNPKSASAQIALMGTLRSAAWAYRGSGYGNTVTEKGDMRYKQLLAKVIEIGRQLRHQHVKDPVLYYYLISAGNGYGISKSELKAWALESAKIQPLFERSYYAAAFALLPRWGGVPGELAAFADWVSEVTGEKQSGLELYFRLVRSLKQSIEDRKYMFYGFDWNKIAQGFANYSEHFQVLDKDLHLMAKLACLHGDRDAAKKYFSLTNGEWNHFAQSIWRKPEVMQQFKQWSEQEASPDFNAILRTLVRIKEPLLTQLFEMIERYVKVGGDLNRMDVYGNSLLHISIENGQTELAKHLIGLGADINVLNGIGYNPLHLAAQYDRREILRLLIRRGADSGAQSKNGKNTAMHFAARNGFTNVVKDLMEKNIGLINLQNKLGHTPLHEAALEGHYQVVILLVQSPELQLDLQTLDANTAMHLAVSRGHFNIVRLLVEQGSDSNVLNRNNHTALSMAKEQQFVEIVAYLQSKGVKDSAKAVSEQDRKKATVLINQGLKNFTAEGFNQAKTLYQEALKLDPNNFMAYYHLALLAWQLERDPAQADIYIRNSIEINPNYAESYYVLGRINHALGKPEVYKPMFKKYVKLAPNTYNTKDLLKNYSHFLTDEIKVKIDTQSMSSVATLNNENQKIYGLLGFLALLVLFKIRRPR